tara:strand:- start:1994 stop:2203 length:210 start_codon:yes stop_codon:yes gene_type:complete
MKLAETGTPSFKKRGFAERPKLVNAPILILWLGYEPKTCTPGTCLTRSKIVEELELGIESGKSLFWGVP